LLLIPNIVFFRGDAAA